MPKRALVIPCLNLLMYCICNCFRCNVPRCTLSIIRAPILRKWITLYVFQKSLPSNHIGSSASFRIKMCHQRLTALQQCLATCRIRSHKLDAQQHPKSGQQQRSNHQISKCSCCAFINNNKWPHAGTPFLEYSPERVCPKKSRPKLLKNVFLQNVPTTC